MPNSHKNLVCDCPSCPLPLEQLSAEVWYNQPMINDETTAAQPSTIAPVVQKFRLGEQPTDFAYWQTQPYEARLAALEQIRQEYIAWHYDPEPRFQRVYTIVKRE